MSGPRRIFELFTDVELADALAKAKLDISSGTITATGGTGKSGSMDVMSAADRLFEINNEYAIRNRTARPRAVVQVLNGDAFGPRFYCGY